MARIYPSGMKKEEDSHVLLSDDWIGNGTMMCSRAKVEVSRKYY